MSPDLFQITEPSELDARLGLSLGAGQRLAQLPHGDEVQLVDGTAAVELMQLCSVRVEDQKLMLAARPDPARDPDWWQLLSGCVAELEQRMDRPLPAEGFKAWPRVPESAGPVGMFLYAWALLAAVPTGPLVEAESVESVECGLAFFAEHYPEEPISALVCRSWILDPQLREYLPADSNLIRFQRRFQLLPYIPSADPNAGDRELMRLGLGLHVSATGSITEEEIERVPQTTTLQRAYLSHLRRGRHWHKRTGIQWVIR